MEIAFNVLNIAIPLILVATIMAFAYLIYLIAKKRPFSHAAIILISSTILLVVLSVWQSELQKALMQENFFRNFLK